jgi:hypothetical protein
MAVLFVPNATAVFIVVVVVAVLEAVWPVIEGTASSVSPRPKPKFTVLLLPVTAPTDCVCAMVCVVADAAALAATPALAEAAAAVGVTTAGLKTGIAILTSQHCVTTQHATVGQEHVVGHAQLQHVEVVQLVH